MRGRTIRAPEKRAKFLQELAETCNVGESCSRVGIGRQTAYDWRDADPSFKADWDAALERGAIVLEDEAKRRAVQGVEEPVFHRGEICGKVRKYSDTLLIFLMKGAMPDKYKERQATEVTGKDGGPIQMSHEDDDKRIAELLAKAKRGSRGRKSRS